MCLVQAHNLDREQKLLEKIRIRKSQLNPKAMKTEKYYVYVRPGYIEYFDDLVKAQEFANEYGVLVKEC